MNAPKLTTMYIHITNRCNMRCKHCWVNASPSNEYSVIAVKPEAVLRCINEAYELGLRDVLIGGGEPLLVWSAVQEIIKHLYNLGIRSRLETNALLLTKDKISVLNKYECYVSVSLDSADPKYFENFRQVRGVFNKIINNIKALIIEGVPVRIVMTVTRLNMHDIENVARLVISLGAKSMRINPVQPMGRAKHLTELLRAEDYIELAKIIVSIYDRYGKELDFRTSLPMILMARYGVRYLKLAEGHCNYKNLLGILPNGGISLCAIGIHYRELVIGNIFRDHIKKLWLEGAGFLGELRAVKPNVEWSL